MNAISALKMSASEAAASAAAAPRAKLRVRDRIFETARQLFYRHGLRAVGVEAIAYEAGTNKVSFYRSFPSKDELIAEYLRDQCLEYWQWWDAAVAPYEGDPRRQLEALFDRYMKLTCMDGSRGCSLGNAVIELPEGAHPGREVIEQHKSEMRRRLRKFAHELGAADADELGDALMLLMEGGYLTRLTFDGDGPIAVAGKAVRRLIDSHLRDAHCATASKKRR
ncbi:MAG: Transcriptional regulator, TetR family [Nevskia sp.]|nr:Transcriptional regulator, TetR family [Nevskia sp.]